MGDKDSWEPLPQRRKVNSRRRRSSLEPEKDESGNKVAKSDVYEDNVAKRQKAVRAENTLESTDGCDGEFYEYLDHTADVQCHVWGKTLEDAFMTMIPCMFNYMTDLTKIDIVPKHTIEFSVEAHDMESLLFRWMDEFLFRFCSDQFCCKKATIISFDREKFKIKVRGEGDIWDSTKHPQGTEIKAITYSNMQIHEKEERTDLYVIVDI